MAEAFCADAKPAVAIAMAPAMVKSIFFFMSVSLDGCSHPATPVYKLIIITLFHHCQSFTYEYYVNTIKKQFIIGFNYKLLLMI